MVAKGVEDAGLDPLRGRLRFVGTDSGSQATQVDVETETRIDWKNGNNTLRPGIPESGSWFKPEMIPAPDSPSLSVQLPPPRVPSGMHPNLGSSSDKGC